MTRITRQFLRGAGSVLDLAPVVGPSRVGRGINLNRSDAEALRRDWQRVADDFRTAFDRTTKDSGEDGQSTQAK